MKIVKKISGEGEVIQKEIADLERTIGLAKDEIRALSANCNHEFRELTPSELKDEWMSVGARCLVCGAHFGWRCKKSPDSVCHYYSSEGKVELIDGTFVNVPEGHEPDNESDDRCIFDGQPDERK